MEKQEAYETWMEIQCRFVSAAHSTKSEFARGMLTQEFISFTAKLVMSIIDELPGELET